MAQQYFTDQAPAQDDELRLLEFSARGHDLRMQVSDKVFSGTRLDLGTRQLLAEAPELPEGGDFLDLGCGWGPLATVLGLERPEARVWAVDVNRRALDLTARNAAAHGAAGVLALHADEAHERALAEGVRFAEIWSNPPVRIGKDAMHEMLTRWLSLLAPQGRAHLVVQRNLGADSLIAWLNTEGWPAEKIASKKGYRIIEVRPRG